jgi:hypothetical protein
MLGIMDGVSLSHFVPGLTYEVSDSLGGYLVTNGAADEVFASLPMSDQDEDVSESAIFGGVSVTWPLEVAAENARGTAGRRARKRR